MLFSIITYRAQGLSCGSATMFATTNESKTNQTINTPEVWYTFVADSSTIAITLNNVTNGDSLRFELFSGTCSSLNLVDTLKYNDSCQYIFGHNFINGQQYFIKIIKIFPVSCSICITNATNFDLKLSNFSLGNRVMNCDITTCNNHVLNGGFESNLYGLSGFDPIFPFNLNQVDCWGAAFGSPQIGHLGGGHNGSQYYATMWNKDVLPATRKGEGVFTNLKTPLIAGHRYTLEFWIRNSAANPTAPTPSFSAVLGLNPADAGLTAEVPPAPFPFQQGTEVVVVSSSQTVASVSNFNNASWTKITACFEARFNYTILYFFPLNGNSGVIKWIDLDDVQLNEVIADAGADQTICSGQSVTLGPIVCPAPVGGNYINWSPSFGLSCINCPNPVASPPATTTYTFTIGYVDPVTEEFCVYESDQVTVTVNPTPTIVLTESQNNICAGQSVNISASVTSPSGVPTGTFLWSPGGETTSTIFINPTSTTTYSCSYTLNGCVTSSSVTINVNPQPKFDVVGSTTACANPIGFYTINPVDPGVNYTWSTSTGVSGTGATAIYTFPSSGGTITFTGITPFGCKYTNSLYVGSCCSPAGMPNFINKNASALAVLGTTSGGVITITNQTFAINGVFTVNQNLVLKGCDLRMGYLAKIIVDPGVSFTVTNNGILDKTHIYACNEMWDGIYTNSPSASVLLNNGTTIEDAINAIYTENKAPVTITSSAVTGNVIFNKNYRNVVVKNSSSGTYPVNIDNTTFQCYDGVPLGNPSNTANKLHFPYISSRSYIGIEISNVNSITVGIASALKTNTFDNLDFGVGSYNSSVFVYNNTFKNITPTLVSSKDECVPGTAICAIGNPVVSVIKNLNVGSTSLSPFFRNTFDNCGRGVVFTQNIKAVVSHNDFNLMSSAAVRASLNYQRNIDITNNAITNSRTGIDCYDNRQSTIVIDNNSIDANSIANAQGVAVNEVIQSAVYKITNNNIYHVRFGINVNGLKLSDVSRNNVMITHTATPSQQCYGVRLTNSTLCNVVANWVQGQNSTDYWVNGIALDLCTSNYVVCNESHTVGTGLFFGGFQTPNTYIAKNQMDNNLRGFTLNFGEVGPQYTPGTPIKPNDNRWTGSFVYHTYSFNSTGANSTLYTRNVNGQYKPNPYLSFSNPNPLLIVPINPIFGNLNTLLCPLILHPIPDQERRSMLQIAGDSINPLAYVNSSKWLLKQSLYKYLQSDSSLVPAEPLLAQFKNTHSHGNVGKIIYIESVLENIANAGSTDLLNAKSENMTIINGNDAEGNSKWINSMLLDNAIANSTYTDSQLADLRLLATKCPYNDGAAVYQARAVLSHFETAEYTNECELLLFENNRAMTTETIQEQATALSDFKLYPNPNDGSMNFVYTLNAASQGQFILYDITGKIISTHTLQQGNKNQLFINETLLDNGMYFYKVIIDNELKMNDKIIISK